MSVESDLFTLLSPLVAGRVYDTVFKQPTGDVPEWPAIRFFRVLSAQEPSLCGTGGEDQDDITLQIDVVHTTAKLRNELVAAVVEAMHNYPHANERVGRRDDPFESSTKTFRASLDYTIFM
jgi:hypothetical protein